MWFNSSIRSKVAIFTVLLFMLTMVVTVLPADAATAGGLKIEWFKPEAFKISGDNSEVRYRVPGALDPASIYFCWNFSNGLSDYKSHITLKTKDGSTVIELQKEDLKYTKQQTPKLRQLELILSSTTLKPGTEYVIELGPGIKANNGDTLGKTYAWEFTTGGVSDAPALTADTDNNTVGQAVDITFTDDSAWRGAINSIKVNGSALDENQYIISAGKLNIAASVLDKAGDYTIVINAEGYKDVSIIQTIKSDITEPEPPAVETEIVAEITTDNNVSLNFIREDEQGELMIIVVPEGKGNDPQLIAQFTVMVDGQEVEIVEVKKVKRPGKIKLILATPIKEGQEVTVKYAKGEDEDLWLKFTNGDIVESFDFTPAGEKESEEPKPEQPEQPEKPEQPIVEVENPPATELDKDGDAKLPRTGGFPVEVFYGFGVLLAATGAFVLRKKNAS